MCFWKVEDHNFHHVLIRSNFIKISRSTVSLGPHSVQKIWVRKNRNFSLKNVWKWKISRSKISLFFGPEIVFRTQKFSTSSDPNWPCSSRFLWNCFGSKRGENYGLLLSINIWFPYAPEQSKRWKFTFTFAGLLRLWIRHQTLISVPVSWNVNDSDKGGRVANVGREQKHFQKKQRTLGPNI